MTESSTDFDVLIIGGGPAGLSAGLWCAELGLSAVIFEKEAEFGGQLLWTYNAIKNYLGVEAANGRELRDRFLNHIENKKIQRILEDPVVEVDLANKDARLSSGKLFSGKALIIATGVRRRRLGIPGELEFAGRGVLESGVKCKEDVTGKTVVIAGGGDAALENAIILSDTARKVVVVHRNKTSSARSEFIKQADARHNIEFLFNTSISAIVGAKALEAVEVVDSITQKQRSFNADNVLIRIGVVPNTELFAGQIKMDNAGYIIVDPQCATSRNNIFTTGDVASLSTPTISNAVGQGSVVAKAIVKMLNP